MQYFIEWPSADVSCEFLCTTQTTSHMCLHYIYIKYAHMQFIELMTGLGPLSIDVECHVRSYHVYSHASASVIIIISWQLDRQKL